jgi:uncharacterized membrane protein
MSEVMSQIDVDVPISVVYNQWTLFESFPDFMGGVDEITQLDDTHTHWKVSVAGVEWKSVDGTSHAGVVTFHQLSPETTRVHVQLDWTPQGIVEKAGSLLNIDDAQVKSDLKKFKELIEARGAEAGGWRGDVDRAPDATGR